MYSSCAKCVIHASVKFSNALVTNGPPFKDCDDISACQVPCTSCSRKPIFFMKHNVIDHVL